MNNNFTNLKLVRPSNQFFFKFSYFGSLSGPVRPALRPGELKKKTTITRIHDMRYSIINITFMVSSLAGSLQVQAVS